MVIYLQHPVHGVKVATLEQEAEYDEMNGWVRCADPSAPEPEPVVESAMRRRPGRPRKEPHDNGDRAY